MVSYWWNAHASCSSPTTTLRQPSHCLISSFVVTVSRIHRSDELPAHRTENFLIYFYHDFAKIYGPPEILQNYTYTVVTHGVRDNAVAHDVRSRQ
jgi:hypothetical protein